MGTAVHYALCTSAIGTRHATAFGMNIRQWEPPRRTAGVVNGDDQLGADLS